MTKIENEIKKRIQPLLQKLNCVNKLVWTAQKEGYEVELSCWGRTLGTKGTGTKISLIGFEKNLVGNKKKTLSPRPIENKLKKVNQELAQIEEEGYGVEITTHRSNGSGYLFLEQVHIILLDEEFDFKQSG